MFNKISVVLIVAGTLTLGACDRSRIDIAMEKSTLQDLGRALAAAEAARDLDAVMRYWSDGGVAQIDGAPQIEGKESVRELMRSMLSSFKEFESTTSHIEVAASGDLAYEYGVNRVVLPGDETDFLAMGKYLAIWTKVDGNWLISAISVTNDGAATVPNATE